MKRFDSSQERAGMPEGAARVETETPVRGAGIISDLQVPLGQAITTGVLLGALVGFAADKWGLVTSAAGLLSLWLQAAVVIGAVVWLVLLVDTRKLLRTIEKVVGLDLDGDGHKGQPERVIVVNAERAARERQQLERGARVSQFVDFVSRIPVKGTSLRSWEKQLGRDVYCEYRDLLIRLGWAAWRSVGPGGRPNQTQGWDLVVPPEVILSRVSDAD
jgi:hypothetical protein